jgi:hypothetical protein
MIELLKFIFECPSHYFGFLFLGLIFIVSFAPFRHKL